MKLEKIEQKTAKSGSAYLQLGIDGKSYNYFGTLGDIKLGDEILCEFETKGKFTNLKAIEKVINQQIMQPQASNEQNKNTTMYVSYVKDLVVSGKSLEEAIKIVKEAIKEFS